MNQIVLITGASEGIGREMVRLFAREGAYIGAVARRREQLETLAHEVGEDRVLPLAADVRVAPDMERAAQQVMERWGRIDSLVNNAGVAKYVPLTEMTHEQFQWQLDVNLKGLFNACKAVVPYMKQQAAAGGPRPAGQILNISSILGTVGMPGGTAYCATKWGVIGFSEALRMELNADGIRVMVLCPGLTQTDFGGRPASGKEKGLLPATVAWHALNLLTAPPDALPTTTLLRPAAP
ncbi:MAG TPA: SDR family oxidoreductase [Symbiobacteriaceae bacterium]|nr:SDR family oxidoreductase [Symbiobacteriaceae bacterium]